MHSLINVNLVVCDLVLLVDVPRISTRVMNEECTMYIRSTTRICVLIINVQVKLLHCYVNNFVSFTGIGIELGNLSGHRTLITFCKLIANYMYIAYKYS